MDYKDKPYKNVNVFQSFKYAGAGLKLVYQREANFLYETIISLLVIGAGFFFRIEKTEWLVLILCFGSVFSMEIMNSAIETLVDLVVGTKYHELAKWTKDMAAAAVLLVAIMSVVIGLVIFVPYICYYLGS